MVSLLLGHIQLHGLQQPEQAAVSYERVLQGDVDTTIAALAEQGLQRCRAEDIASGAGTTPATTGAIPDLLKDPFLKTDPDQVRPAPADLVTAMPWLTNDEEPRAMATPDPSPTPVPSPEPTVNPEANADVEKQEPAATTLLEHSWLRVQLQTEIKSPIGSTESMGLINRIKGVFARSAGR